jgi:hypothetical protein
MVKRDDFSFKNCWIKKEYLLHTSWYPMSEFESSDMIYTAEF